MGSVSLRKGVRRLGKRGGAVSLAAPDADPGAGAAGVAGGAVRGGEAPGADAPGTAVPGTRVPGGVVPEAEVPGTAAPGTRVPGTVLTGGVVPEAEVPGADAPGTRVPWAVLPGGVAPGAEVSGTRRPGVDVLGAVAPGTAVPGAVVPGGRSSSRPARGFVGGGVGTRGVLGVPGAGPDVVAASPVAVLLGPGSWPALCAPLRAAPGASPDVRGLCATKPRVLRTPSDVPGGASAGSPVPSVFSVTGGSAGGGGVVGRGGMEARRASVLMHPPFRRTGGRAGGVRAARDAAVPGTHTRAGGQPSGRTTSARGGSSPA